MTPIERATLAVIAELHRQGAARGVTVEDNGLSAQVDGAFPVQPLVLAVISAIRELAPPIDDAGRDVTGGYPYAPHDIPKLGYMQIAIIWHAMIDKLLEQGRQ